MNETNQTKLDCRGLLCPEPVVRVQRALAAKPDALIVCVDAFAAKENVSRFARSRGYAVETKQEGAEWALTLVKQ